MSEYKHAENESLGNSVKLQAEGLYEARTKAITEFAERVINLIYSADDINPITEWQIYDIVAEMMKGE